MSLQVKHRMPNTTACKDFMFWCQRFAAKRRLSVQSKLAKELMVFRVGPKSVYTLLAKTPFFLALFAQNGIVIYILKALRRARPEADPQITVSLPLAEVFETPCRIETESQPCPFIEKLRCKRGCHTLKRMCGQNTESLVNGCTNRCPTQLACGHECPNRCFSEKNGD